MVGLFRGYLRDHHLTSVLELGTLKPHKAYRKFAGLLGAPAKPTKAEISIQLGS